MKNRDFQEVTLNIQVAVQHIVYKRLLKFKLIQVNYRKLLLQVQQAGITLSDRDYYFRNETDKVKIISHS